MKPEIVWQDENFIVLNKPTGWIVNRCRTTRGKVTIEDWLQEADFDKREFTTLNVKGYRNGIVHRLDKGTSGILLIAKKKDVFENLQKQFYQRQVQKEYLALVHGTFPKDHRVLAPVGRLPWNREKFGIIPGGKQSQTKFILKTLYHRRGEKYSLISAFPKTGRTHQIRVHLRYLKMPIVADEAYVGRKRYRQDQRWCPRIFLHAFKIIFFHPKTGKKVNYQIKLPPDLEKALMNLTEDQSTVEYSNVIK